MKKFKLAFLISTIFAGLAGCGTVAEPAMPTMESTNVTVSPKQTEPTEESVVSVVSNPMQRPDYTFDHTPSTDELRQTAVKAMRDMLSVQWSIDRPVSFTESYSYGDVSISLDADKLYAGLPYTDAAGTIVQWYEFYDQQTGLFDLDSDGRSMNKLVGNTCATAVCSAWMTVCDSIRGGCFTRAMVPMYGFIPVGDYTIQSGIISYGLYGTDLICADNGQEVMFDAYSKILPADALVSTPDVHAIMAIEPAHVVYTSDGKIDPDASIIVIQDQRSGHRVESFLVEENGVSVHYSGRLRHEYTFSELWRLGYIPVTAAEFLGTDGYCEPEVKANRACEAIEDLKRVTITSNYPICVAKTVVEDGEGNREVLERILFGAKDIESGVARSLRVSSYFNLNPQEAPLADLLQAGKTYTLSIEVTVTNGQTFTPVSVKISQ